MSISVDEYVSLGRWEGGRRDAPRAFTSPLWFAIRTLLLSDQFDEAALGNSGRSAGAHLRPQFLILQVLEEGMLPQHALQGWQWEAGRPKMQAAETDLHQPLHIFLLGVLQQACR